MGRWEPSTDGRTGLFQHQPHHHTYTVHILPPYATVSPMRDPDHGSQSSHGGTGRINLHKCIIIAKRPYQPQTTAAGIRWPHRIRIAHWNIGNEPSIFCYSCVTAARPPEHAIVLLFKRSRARSTDRKNLQSQRARLNAITMQ